MAGCKHPETGEFIPEDGYGCVGNWEVKCKQGELSPTGEPCEDEERARAALGEYHTKEKVWFRSVSTTGRQGRHHPETKAFVPYYGITLIEGNWKIAGPAGFVDLPPSEPQPSKEDEARAARGEFRLFGHWMKLA